MLNHYDSFLGENAMQNIDEYRLNLCSFNKLFGKSRLEFILKEHKSA
jgi:hypothetical protein